MIRSIAVVAAFIMWSVTGAFAQTFPAKPIRIIVPWPAGGSADLWARIIGQKLSEAWGQNVLVDNRAGASGIIGTELAGKAAPDGYTLLMSTFSTHSTNPVIFKKLPYDPLRDFAPVTNFVGTPFMLVVHPSIAVKSLQDLIGFAKTRPGQLTYASWGNGSSVHLVGELFKSLARIDLLHVPYKGGAPAMNDLVGGQVSMMFNTLTAVVPLVKAGRLRGIAIASLQRANAAADIPTFAEAGLPGVEASAWYGVSAPARTPEAVVAKLHAGIAAVLKLPDVQQRLIAEGAVAIGNTPEQFAAQIKDEIAKWGKIVRESGLQTE